MVPNMVSNLYLLFVLATLSSAQYEPVRDFCRRWGHRTAVVDNKLYIDGGLVIYKPFDETSQNMTSEPTLSIHDRL